MKPEIAIVIEGGCICAIATAGQGIIVRVIDLDQKKVGEDAVKDYASDGDEPVEPVEVSMRYFYIKTNRLEQFLEEMDKLCQTFAAKNEREQPDFSYDWDAI